jgi:hypothetical protein
VRSERTSSERSAQDFLDQEATRLQQVLAGAPEPAHRPLVRWVPAIVGGVLLAGGVGLYAWSKVDLAAITPGNRTNVPALVSRGEVTQPLGLTLAGVGLAGIVASFFWALLAPDVVASLGPIPGGAMLSLGVRLPSGSMR